MPPYYHSIIKGVATIMVSYSSLNGEKMHADRNLITSFLKNTLRFRVNKFTSNPFPFPFPSRLYWSNRTEATQYSHQVLKLVQGFVISDMEGIDWITSPPHANYTYSIQAGIQAGIDMVSCA